jgi:uncharacterized protein
LSRRRRRPPPPPPPRRRNGPRRRHLHQRPQHHPSRNARDPGRHDLDNTWAALNDGFAEGGYKESGIGRLRGPLAITEFQEAKTVVHAIPPFPTKETDMPTTPAETTSPIEVVGEWLQNLMDPDVVERIVAPDATYVSLNAENAELNQILPWAGTSHGPQAFLNALGVMFSRWATEGFNVTTMFASDENVAVFGDFRYRSHSLGKIVTSPFSMLVKVVDGKVTYVQFLEDTYATAASFRKDGSWTVQTEPDASPFEVQEVQS